MKRFEDFQQRTLPFLKRKDVVKIQAVARGWLARNGKFKHKVTEHIASVQIVDNMITKELEDNLIPEILLQILRKN